MNIIQGDWDEAWTNIKNILGAAWDLIWATIQFFINQIIAFIRAFKDTIIAIFSNAITWLVAGGKAIVTGLWDGIKNIWLLVIGWFRFLPFAVKDFFVGAGKWIFESGKAIIQGLWDGLKDIWEDIKNWFLGIPKWIKDHKGPISVDKKMLRPAGQAIMKGLLDGLKSGSSAALSWLKGIGVSITDLFSAWFFSPGQVLDFLGDLFTSGGSGSSRGLVGFAKQAMTLFRNMFPGMTIGGWRAKGSVPGSDHPKGKALDLMTTNGTIAQMIIRTFRGMAGAKYWIWNREIATKTGGWQPRGYRGPSPHTDHVHLSFYKSGAWNLLRDQLAFLHRGEMVAPAGIASMIRSVGSGGAAQSTVNRGATFNFYGDVTFGSEGATDDFDWWARTKVAGV
jgi:hypothetical protein